MLLWETMLLIWTRMVEPYWILWLAIALVVLIDTLTQPRKRIFDPNLRRRRRR